MRKMILAALYVCATSVHAQTMWQPQIGTWTGNLQFTGQMNNRVFENDEKPSDASTNRTLVSTTYTPSKSRTRANLQNFVNKSRAADPAGAAQMEQLFASRDIMEEIGTVMAQYGLSRSNAADSYAVYWVAAWQAANGELTDRSPATYKAVSSQAARGFSQSPEFAAATDAQKQEMAEALLVQAALIDGAKSAAASDPVQMKAVRKAVAQGAKASGIELEKMTLSDNGFVPKDNKRSKASAAGAGKVKP
jgi:hypothetical protein